MVTKLKEDGLDNVHTEAVQVSVTLSQKGHAIQLNLIPVNLYFHYIFEFVQSMFPYVSFINVNQIHGYY